MDAMTDAPQVRPHTSFSQIETYRRCSMQWYFRYVKGVISPPSLPLARGKAGHAALEFNARKKIATGQDAPLDEILDAFSDNYDNETAGVVLKEDESVGATKDLTIETLRKYRTEVAPSRIPLKVEHAFDLEIPATEDYEYPIKVVNGRIDLVEVDPTLGLPKAKNGNIPLQVADYKFVKYAKNQADVDASWQLTLYDLVITKDTGNAPTALGFVSLREPTQRNAARVEEVRRSPEEMVPAQRKRRQDRLIHVMRTTQKSIDAGIFQPVDDPKTCGWCGYRDICQFSLAKSDWASIQKGAQ